MASTKTRHSMVFLKDGVSSPAAAAADSPPVCFTAQRPEKLNRSETVQSARVFGGETDFKHNMYAVKEVFARTGNNHPACVNTDNISPDCVCKGVRVTLDNNSMWNQCFRCRTEMILTKQGSRMFPYCRFRISGLQPCKKYVLVMDIQPLDNSQYRWTGESWQESRKAECQIKTNPFIHPESPAMGQHWMQSPVSFYKLKLTNNMSDQEGNVILHPLHRYLPILHLVETDKAVKDIRLNSSNVLTFSFPQTEFIAVTTYQNPQFAQLKVNYNPFAKGLKEDGLNLLSPKLKTNAGKESNKDGDGAVAEQHPVKKSLKFLLANHKPRCSKTGDSKPSEPKELNTKTVTKTDLSAANVPGKSPSSSSQSAQKLISEMICEAHVSLQRCSEEQRGTDHSPSVKAAQSNTNTTTNCQVGPRDDAAARSPRREHQTVENSRRIKDDDHPSGSGASPYVVWRNCSGDAAPSAGQPQNSETTQHQKRPARLPLPALALFLKQHSTKHKKSSSNQNTSPPDANVSAAASHAEAAKSCRPDPGEGAAQRPSSPQNHVAAKAESLSSELEVLGDKPEVSNSETPFCSLTLSFSTCSTSSEPSRLSPPLHTVSAPNSPTPPVEESSSLPSDALKTESLLFDPECSSFGFEPLSPATSPEHLHPLPASLSLDINSASSVAASAESAQDPEHREPSSVFKWHTVLPPPETFVESSFTFQPPHHSSPLKSATPPLLPFNVSASTDESAPSFQETEPSLPFPTELSPLNLQLSLSPTFSLDENGLSPAPSLSDLVHFFSTNVDIGIGGEFANTEATPAPCSPPPAAETHEPSLQVQPALVQAPARKPVKRKKFKSTKLARLDMNQNMDDYRSLQPNLEEVEEQLFVTFASKEALRLHVTDTCEEMDPRPQTPPDGQRTSEEPVIDESLEQRIAAFQKILLKDLEVMKHRQVIHPVLQEVGLKMTLLDPALSIDLQYLGVRLPIPPPGASIPPITPSPSEGSSADFLSRTGKTTDVTQIKGWREKFTPSETTPSSVPKPEAGPSSDPQKKNLSAFCSDMLDEYLENEAKLIDERAASFSQPPVEPPVFKLPVSSTSYVRTLDHILKKQTAGPSALDLISGFVPPSKRPQFKKTKTFRRTVKKLTDPKPNKPRPASATPESSSSAPAQPAVPTPEPIIETTQPQNSPTFKRRRKLKLMTSSHTLSPSRLVAPPPDAFEGLAPVESDSELALTISPKKDFPKRESRPRTTRALLKQKDLEDSVALDGRFQTSITEERATIALTSLFTQTGFVSENPTAPIQLKERQMLPCLNEFCRLGCICSSLSHTSRTSHCGWPACMFGCSCLKQKVVLLKNLDSCDSSPSPHHGGARKKKKGRRMKMAYVLKEADSVTKPAERVQTLWRKTDGASDLEPLYIPKMAAVSCPVVQVKRNIRSSSARVRCFRGKSQKRKDLLREARPVRHRDAVLQQLTQKEPTPKETKATTSEPLSAEEPPASPPAESASKPLKRLFIKANCKWLSNADRTFVLKKLCEAMARQQLTKPFRIKQYHIIPISETVQGTGDNQCIQYRVQVTMPKAESEKLQIPVNLATRGRKKILKPAAEQKQNHQLKGAPSEVDPSKAWIKEKAEPLEVQQEEQNSVLEEAVPVPLEDWQKEVVPVEDCQKEMVTMDPVEDWQKEVVPVEDCQKEMVTMDPVEDWQKEVVPVEDCQKEMVTMDPVEDWQKEVVPVEDWQKEVVTMDPVEDWQKEIEGSETEEEKEQHSGPNTEDGQERKTDQEKIKPDKKENVAMALPHLKEVFSSLLSAERKQSGATDHLSQVIRKLLAPSNRQVGNLTEQVGSPMHQQASLSSSILPCKPQSSDPTPVVVSSPSAAASTTSLNPLVTPVTYISPPTDPKPQNLVLCSSSSPIDSRMMVIPSPVPIKTLSPLTQVLTVQSSTGQQMVLHQIQSTSGAQYYRRPDGKLVQLIPIRHLKPVPVKAPTQTGLSSSSMVIPASSSVTPAVVNPALPTLIMPSSSSSVSLSSTPSSSSSVPLSLSPSSSSVMPLAGPIHSQPVFVANQSPCANELGSPSKEPIFVTQVMKAPHCTLQPQDPNPTPASVNLISTEPSSGQRTEQAVKAVSVTSNPEDLVARHQTASKKVYPITPSPAETLPNTEIPSPARSPPAEIPEQELARNPMDLEIVSVDDSVEFFMAEKRSADVVDLLSTSDTEDSSDFSESDREEDKLLHKNTNRLAHVMAERKRREELQHKFENLQKEVGLTRMSKRSTLTQALELIQELRITEDALKRTKRRLKRRRDEYMSVLVPSTATEDKSSDDDVVLEVVDSDNVIEVSSDEETLTGTNSNLKARTKDADAAGELSTKGRLRSCEEKDKALTKLKTYPRAGEVSVEKMRSKMERMRSKMERMRCRMERMKRSKEEKETVAAVMNIPKSLRRLLPGQAAQEIKAPPRETEMLKSFKSNLNHKQDVKELLNTSDEEVMMVEERLPAGRGLPAASPARDTKTETTPCDPQAPPPSVVKLSNSAVAHPGISHKAPGTTSRTKTIPNILSRSKRAARLSSQRELASQTAVSSSLPLLTQTDGTQHHHQTQLGPGAPPALFYRNQPSRTHRSAFSFSPFPRMDSDLQPGGGPPGPDPQQNPESESMSSLLNEIVFLNQTAVVKAVATQNTEKLSIQDPGGAATQTHTPGTQLRQLDSVEPGPIDLTETGNKAKQPGPDSVNTNCGVLAPPPLLHMKMGGAKVSSLTKIDSTAVEGAGSMGVGKGVGWRPMPRLVPLGVQGNSPS